VRGLHEACAVRWLEHKHPEMIDVCRAMGQYSVKEKLPYIGAILTGKGKKNKKSVIECLYTFYEKPNYNRSEWR